MSSKKRSSKNGELIPHAIDPLIDALLKDYADKNKLSDKDRYELPLKTTLYRRGHRDGFAKKEKAEQKKAEPDTKRQRKVPSDQLIAGLPRLWRIKQDHPDVWADLLVRRQERIGHLDQVTAQGCQVPKYPSDGRPNISLHKYNLGEKFGHNVLVYQITAVDVATSEPGDNDQASHYCHVPACMTRVVVESYADNQRRERCRKGSKCICCLAPACIIFE